MAGIGRRTPIQLLRRISYNLIRRPYYYFAFSYNYVFYAFLLSFVLSKAAVSVEAQHHSENLFITEKKGAREAGRADEIGESAKEKKHEEKKFSFSAGCLIFVCTKPFW